MDKERAQACLCGWVEVLADRFEALLFFVEKEEKMKEQELKNGFESFTVERLLQFYENK
jgi:hypothetical protein